MERVALLELPEELLIQIVLRCDRPSLYAVYRSCFSLHLLVRRHRLLSAWARRQSARYLASYASANVTYANDLGFVEEAVSDRDALAGIIASAARYSQLAIAYAPEIVYRSAEAFDSVGMRDFVSEVRPPPPPARPCSFGCFGACGGWESSAFLCHRSRSGGVCTLPLQQTIGAILPVGLLSWHGLLVVHAAAAKSRRALDPSQSQRDDPSCTERTGNLSHHRVTLGTVPMTYWAEMWRDNEKVVIHLAGPAPSFLVVAPSRQTCWDPQSYGQRKPLLCAGADCAA